MNPQDLALGFITLAAASLERGGQYLIVYNRDQLSGSTITALTKAMGAHFGCKLVCLGVEGDPATALRVAPVDPAGSTYVTPPAIAES